MTKMVLSLALIMLFAGCAPRAGVVDRVTGQSNPGRPFYSYAEVDPDVFYVVAEGQSAYRDVIDKLCGRHVCTVEPVGQFYVLEVHR